LKTLTEHYLPFLKRSASVNCLPSLRRALRSGLPMRDGLRRCACVRLSAGAKSTSQRERGASGTSASSGSSLAGTRRRGSRREQRA